MSHTGVRSNQTHRLDLADGRALRVFESGAADGLVVVFLHGTPGCGRMRDTVIADAGERGARGATGRLGKPGQTLFRCRSI
jgi:hypothetical protein